MGSLAANSPEDEMDKANLSTPAAEQTAEKKKRKRSRGGKKKTKEPAPQEQAAPTVPNDYSSWAMKQTSDRGIGLFATTNIPTGTRIISETPLMTITASENDPDTILDKYTNLQPVPKATFLSLDAIEDSEITSFRQNVEMLTEMREALGPRTPGNSERLEAVEEALHTAEVEYKVLATFRTNSLTTSTCDCDQDAAASGPSQGIFSYTARLNHSCVPNTHVHYNTHLGRMMVHTIRPVAEGEELTMSYLSEGQTYTMPSAARGELLKRWGFRCTCAACLGPEARAHDTRRKEIGVKISYLRERLDEDGGARGDAAKAVMDGVVRDVISDLEREQCGGFVLAEMRMCAADLLVTVPEKGKVALVHARVGLRVMEICVGADNCQMMRYQKRVRELEKAVEGKGKEVVGG